MTNDKAVPLLDPGQSATVGGLDVTVLGGALDRQELVLTVEVAAPADGAAISDFAAGWQVLSPTGQPLTTAPARPVDASNGPPCANARLDPGTTVMCHILFAVDGTATSAAGFTVVYTRDNESGAWLLQ